MATKQIVRLCDLKLDALPTRIRAQNESCGIEKDDYIDVYFKKNTKMVEMISSEGKRYLLPLSSSLECSVLYNPENNIDKALDGYNFSSVSMLMDASPLPSMVCVETGFYHEPTNVSLESEEILVISGKTSRDTLVLNEVSTLTTKNVSKEFECSFVTNPDSLFMPITDFIHLIELPTPIVLKSFLKNGRKEMYTLMNVFTVQSVVGKIFRYPSHSDQAQLIELYLDVPLRLQVIDLPDHSTAALLTCAHKAFDIFRPALCKAIINDTVYENDDTQRLLLTCISLAKWKILVQIFPPHHHHSAATTTTTTQTTTSSSSANQPSLKKITAKNTPAPTTPHSSMENKVPLYGNVSNKSIKRMET